MQDDPTIPAGLCQCGCGERTKIITNPHAARGYFMGKPYRFVAGHGQRRPHRYRVRDCGYKTPCWLWRLALNPDGYGIDNRVLAHQSAYVAAHGTVPRGMEVDHLCRVRHCVNPDHLEAVSHAQNMQRSSRAKLTVEQVREIRARYAWRDAHVLAREFGVSASTIQRVGIGASWKDV